MPTATASSGTSRKTTEFAPILAFLPIIIFPKSFAPVPTVTFSFNVGCLLVFEVLTPPRVTPW